MMTTHRAFFVCAVCAVSLFSVTAVAGTIITNTPPGVSGPGLGFASVAAVITVQANNDNVPSPNKLDNNIIVPLKRFDNAGYIDIQFATDLSDGVTEYNVSEFVDNNTGLPWTNYRMELGYGTGAAFVKSATGDGLDFDAPDYDTPPTSAPFPLVGTPDEDTLVYGGGVHGSGAQSYSFRIDVPDLPNIRLFTLRQIPVAVPEPGTATFLLLMMASSVLGRRR